MLADFIIKQIEGTKNVNRWQGRTVIKPTTIAEHMHGTTMIADIIAMLEINEYGNEVDELKICKYAIYHDGMEVITTDLPSVVKRKAKIMERAINIVENKCYEEEISSLLPKKYADIFKPMFLDPKEGKKTIEGKIIHFADNLYALIECIIEINCGNKRFECYLKDVMKELLKTDLQSGRYLLKYGIPRFGLEAEIYGESYIQFLQNEYVEDIRV